MNSSRAPSRAFRFAKAYGGGEGGGGEGGGEGGGGEGGGEGGGGGGGDGCGAQTRSAVAVQSDTMRVFGALQTVHAAHVPPVMVLSELQTSAPAPARAHARSVKLLCGWRVVARKKPGVVVVRRQAWLRRTCVVLAAGTAAADVAGVVAVRVVRVARSTRVAARITVSLTPSFASARSIAIVT